MVNPNIVLTMPTLELRIAASNAAQSLVGSRVISSFTLQANEAYILPTGNLAAGNADYYTVTFGVARAGAIVNIGSFTTQTVGLTGATARALTHSSFTFLPGDVLVGSIAVTAGAPAAFPVSSIFFDVLQTS